MGETRNKSCMHWFVNRKWEKWGDDNSLLLFLGFFLYCFVLFFCFFQDRVWYLVPVLELALIDKAGLELTETQRSDCLCLPSTGIKACTTTTWPEMTIFVLSLGHLSHPVVFTVSCVPVYIYVIFNTLWFQQDGVIVSTVLKYSTVSEYHWRYKQMLS